MDSSAGKTDLSGMRGHVVGALGEENARLFALYDRQQNRGGLECLTEVEFGRHAIETSFDARAPRARIGTVADCSGSANHVKCFPHQALTAMCCGAPFLPPPSVLTPILAWACCMSPTRVQHGALAWLKSGLI